MPPSLSGKVLPSGYSRRTTAPRHSGNHIRRRVFVFVAIIDHLYDADWGRAPAEAMAVGVADEAGMPGAASSLAPAAQIPPQLLAYLRRPCPGCRHNRGSLSAPPGCVPAGEQTALQLRGHHRPCIAPAIDSPGSATPC